MNAIYFDSTCSDIERREALYAGQLFVYSPTPASRALCDLARDLTRQAFSGLDPETAQHELPQERYAAILAELKPRFIHHEEAKRLIPAILESHGCDPAQTYFDVPRLRTATSHNYLTTGIAYAFHPHRDTWYSAPMCQINWWMPVYDVEANNVMAIHPAYWDRPVKNGSAGYNYQEWNRTSRFIAAQQIGVDTRQQPKPEEPVELDPQIRVVAPVGGLWLFSAAHLHSTVPNDTGRTRFSIDFRTVNYGDVAAGRGAPNCDSRCTGTSMGDFLRATDLAHVPEELIEKYMPGPGALVGR